MSDDSPCKECRQTDGYHKMDCSRRSRRPADPVVDDPVWLRNEVRRQRGVIVEFARELAAMTVERDRLLRERDETRGQLDHAIQKYRVAFAAKERAEAELASAKALLHEAGLSREAAGLTLEGERDTPAGGAHCSHPPVFVGADGRCKACGALKHTSEQDA